MNVFDAVTIMVSFGLLPTALMLLVVLRKHIERAPLEPCPECGYEVHSIDPDSPCPECGYKRSLGLIKRRCTAVEVAYRVAVALLAPGLTAMVSAAMSLVMQPLHTLHYAVLVSCAPYAISVIAVLAVYRPRAGDGDVVAKVLLGAAAVCNIVMAYVMHSYWSDTKSNDDYGWPMSHVMMYAVVLGVVVIAPGCAIAAFACRRMQGAASSSRGPSGRPR